MDLGVRHYASLWQEVLDVSATEPFDLLCREGDRELRVEVKGTTSLGLSVLLTRNEVRHAQENSGRVALSSCRTLLLTFRDAPEGPSTSLSHGISKTTSLNLSHSNVG